MEILYIEVSAVNEGMLLLAALAGKWDWKTATVFSHHPGHGVGVPTETPEPNKHRRLLGLLRFHSLLFLLFLLLLFLKVLLPLLSLSPLLAHIRRPQHHVSSKEMPLQDTKRVQLQRRRRWRWCMSEPTPRGISEPDGGI